MRWPLIEARVRLHLSQEEVGARAGVTRWAISKLESGHTDPSLTLARRLAKVLGHTIDELFGDEGPGDSSVETATTTAATTSLDTHPAGVTSAAGEVPGDQHAN